MKQDYQGLARPPWTISTPDKSYLRECFDYDDRTGYLFWRSRPRRHFKSEVAFGRSNALAGKRAMTTINGRGYLVGGLDRIQYRTHRIIWKWWYGNDAMVVDHLNGNPLDNRIVNLRDVTLVGNARNRSVGKNNRSGVPGVLWNKPRRRWKSFIGVMGKEVFLGWFPRREDAVRARYAAEITYGFMRRGQSQAIRPKSNQF